MAEKYIVYLVDWLESERSWGIRPDGISLHLTFDDVKSYIQEYWDSQPIAVPDEYSRPCGVPKIIQVNAEIFKKVQSSKNGIRIYNSDLRDLGLYTSVSPTNGQ
jgi:hypothetical protein